MLEPLLVDTGYIIAIINDNDEYHAQAMEWSVRFDSHSLIITDAVLLEIGNALSRKYRKEAVEAIHTFQTADEVNIIHLNPLLFKAGLKLYETYQDKTCGLVDCVSFVVMREMNITTALTFDQHFVQAGFRIPDMRDDS